MTDFGINIPIQNCSLNLFGIRKILYNFTEVSLHIGIDTWFGQIVCNMFQNGGQHPTRSKKDTHSWISHQSHRKAGQRFANQCDCISKWCFPIERKSSMREMKCQTFFFDVLDFQFSVKRTELDMVKNMIHRSNGEWNNWQSLELEPTTWHPEWIISLWWRNMFGKCVRF